MKTYNAKASEVRRSWFLYDADGKVLGRLACEVARRLRGKHKAIYTPHVDTGDFIIVVNADKILLTGKKVTDKIYYHHTGYPGGIRSRTAGKLRQEKPERLFHLAVKGMLPKNSLGRKMLKKLKVYSGNTHPHEAQKPDKLEL
ncbi:MAG TPA: 50S ribosomal protein L13 [Syntrophales bacterium]|nr:50S ribosomal protein L13 [Syntrophales bacterium]HQB29347.1 50S ribosomal protein L13 [Syntrophales bacterium]HQN77488.1 50S ribosomal protein L13 [Syntrophales bacterium]HQQ27557.1 50S ribosomal protein L13 [Syntrophales bacterium]